MTARSAHLTGTNKDLFQLAPIPGAVIRIYADLGRQDAGARPGRIHAAVSASHDLA